MRLNIGAGKRHHAGYLTIDIEPQNKPDVVGDFRKMVFDNVEEIRAEHILEHFGRDESIQVLKQWHEWLVVGGNLIVEVPDFEYICKEFAEQNNYGKYWLTRHAYGSQEADWAFHRDGWWESKLIDSLKEVGFNVITVVRNRTHSFLPNIKVVAKKI